MHETITIRDYIDTLFNATERRNEDRFKASEKAIELALAARNDYSSKIMAGVAVLIALYAAWKH